MRRLLILVLIGGASLSAQSIKVAPSTHVATGSAEHPIVEPHLAVDPMHPDRLLTAAFARANPRLKFPEGQDNQTCAAFLSLDSGASWTRDDSRWADACNDGRQARSARTAGFKWPRRVSLDR